MLIESKMSCNEYDIKKNIIDDLELYCDTRLHEIYLKYHIKII